LLSHASPWPRQSSRLRAVADRSSASRLLPMSQPRCLEADRVARGPCRLRRQPWWCRSRRASMQRAHDHDRARCRSCLFQSLQSQHLRLVGDGRGAAWYPRLLEKRRR